MEDLNGLELERAERSVVNPRTKELLRHPVLRPLLELAKPGTLRIRVIRGKSYDDPKLDRYAD